MSYSDFRKSLALKISLAVVALQIFLMAILGVLYVSRFGSEIDERILRQVKAPAALMNEGALSLEAVSRREVISEVAGADILDAMIVGPGNVVYYSVNSEDVGREVSDLPHTDSGLFAGIFGESVFGTDRAGDYVSIEPIYSAAGGAPFLEVYIKASGSAVRAEKRFLGLLFAGGSLLAALLISLALILFFRQAVLKGLHRLTEASRAIGQGSFGDPVLQALPVDRDDEIGSLSRAFREMAEDVRRSRSKLEGYSRHLETDVAERTAELKRRVDELARMNRLMVDREMRMVELKERIRELEGRQG